MLRFVNDVFIDGSVQVIHLPVEDTEQITKVITRYNLDFDDAYQYTASGKYKLQIVSFDTDFDRTERGRKTPAQTLNKK